MPTTELVIYLIHFGSFYQSTQLTPTMESTKIAYIKENIYIPPQPVLKRPSLPERHPSLILNDRSSDTSLTFKCGCKGDKCIKEKAHWLYGPDGEVNNPYTDCTSTESYHFSSLIHDSVGRQL